MKKVKQGHTKFKVVVYDPGKIDGYDDKYVACVYSCFVTKVEAGTIYYQSSSNYPYMCGEKFWHGKLFNTRRQATKEALRQLKEKSQ